jgi:NADH:ubiquinone oxidoreductase subunit C
MMRNILRQLLQEPEKPLGRWCNVGSHPMRKSFDWKEKNKRRREELKNEQRTEEHKNETDPCEHVVVHEFVDW